MNIGFSQRVEFVETHGERRDCLDQRWYRFAHAIDALPFPLPNVTPIQAAGLADAMQLSGIVLTGGNTIAQLEAAADDAAPERDAFEFALLDWARARRLPVVGICRGLQTINTYFGGSATRIASHVATRHNVVFSGRWARRSAREVNSFHDWAVYERDLAPELDVLAVHADGSIEALGHPSELIVGIMWHPEREDPLSPADLDILAEAVGWSAR